MKRLAAVLLLGAALSVTGAAAAAAATVPGAAVPVAPAPVVTVPAATPAVASAAPADPIVLVGIPGLLWTDVSRQATPALWQLAQDGSPGNLVVHAATAAALACPADGWLTLNAGARASAPLTAAGRCPSLPAITLGQAASGQATSGQVTVGQPVPVKVAAMGGLVGYNRQFHYNPNWGLLARAAGPGGCATAIGPGAALALAGQDGRVAGYLPSAAGAGPADFARCPFTVVDLGALPAARLARAAAIRADDRAVGGIRAGLPPGATLVVAAPADGVRPHLHPLIVDGPGYGAGLLDSASTRQPGLTQLTDLTRTLLGWHGVRVPSDAVGSPITRAARGSLAGAIRGLVGQDTAAQVYAGTFGWFFAAYGIVDGVAFGAIGLLLRGRQPGRRRQRAALWRLAGTLAVAVPAASYLASVVSWWLLPHPAIWLYGLTAAWTAVIGGLALAGPWRRDPLGPLGLAAAVAAAVIAVDVATGSRLQLGTPFGLSAVVAGRFYGIGNNAVVIYATAGIFAAAWLAMTVRRRATGADPAAGRPDQAAASSGGPHASSGGLPAPSGGLSALSGGPSAPGGNRRAVLAAAAVGVAVVAVSGWPGFGAKVGGTFAMVPGFLILLMGVAGVKITARRAAAAAVCGAALVVAFSVVNYLIPATGASDIGGFFGQVLHGGAGGTLSRKVGSNVGSLTVSAYALIVPPVVIVAGLMLLRPSWFALKTLPRAWAARPLLRVTLAAIWLVAVLSWFAEDSGVTVVASALPFALPLAIAAAAAASYPGREQPVAAVGGPARQAIVDSPP
jgi:hypothetical protein